MFKRKRLACSFCGRAEADVAKLVAGPKVFICDRCVQIASELMADPSSNRPSERTRARGMLWRIMSRLKRQRRRDGQLLAATSDFS